MNSAGQLQWNHVFVDPNSQYSAAYSVRQTADGGYLVGGAVSYVVTSSYTQSEITVFKLDSTATLVWQHNYAAGVDAYPQSLALTSDGGAIVSGTVSTETATTYTSSVLLLKLDSSGNAQFAQTILPSGDISDLNIVGVQQTADGGYAFAGYYFQNTVYTERAWLVKTDSVYHIQDSRCGIVAVLWSGHDELLRRQSAAVRSAWTSAPESSASGCGGTSGHSARTKSTKGYCRD